MVIDFHAHYPRDDPRFEARLVELLPELRIDRICLCSAGEALGHVSNAEVLAAARRHPELIIPFAYVALGIDSADCVDRCVAEGFRGFKITNPRSGYDDEAYFPLYERMERSGLPLLAHTGILLRFRPPPGMRVNSDWMRPVRLDPMLRAFPELNVIGAHLGVPWHEEASTMARLHPNFYVDLTAAWWGGWRVNKGPEFFHHHFFWEGAWDKVLFGTDILAVDELPAAKRNHDELMRGLDLTAAQLHGIYGGTAARLLHL